MIRKFNREITRTYVDHKSAQAMDWKDNEMSIELVNLFKHIYVPRSISDQNEIVVIIYSLSDDCVIESKWKILWHKKCVSIVV